MLLAFDTSSAAVTVALHDGTSVVAEQTQIGALAHAELLAPAIATVLAEAGGSRSDLTSIAVGVGPGPFTGLRVGVTTALVMGAALHIPVFGVCSLDVIAREAVGADDLPALTGPFLVATDARRREVYWAKYDAEGGRLEGPSVDRPAELAEALPGLPVVGRGAELYADVLAAADGPAYPSAVVLAEAVAAGKIPVLEPEPLYLRRPDVQEPGKPKKVS